MKQRAGLLGSARSMGWKLALVAGLAPSVAWGQDCEEDADCGHGFQCIHDSAGTSSVVTGAGGSMQAECGDGICEFGAEDIESCPQDCDTVQYCAPAECESNSDCAEGYECGEEIGSNSGFTSAGGSSSSVCGDGTCDFDENNASCAEDCPVYRLCQPIQMTCSTDDDCAAGFYCYLGASDNAVGVAFSSADTGTSGSDTAEADSGSGSTDAGTGGTGFAPPADTTTSGGDESGVCVAESSDSGDSAVSVGTSGNTDGGASGPTGTTSAEDTGGNQSASGGVNGSGGASAVAGSGTPATSGSDGEVSGSDGTGTGSGSDAGGAGSDPDGGGEGSDDDGGCSCAVLGVQGSSGLLGAVLFGLVAGIRRRRSARS